MKKRSFYLLIAAMIIQFNGILAQKEFFLPEKSIFETTLDFGNVDHFSTGQAAFMCVDAIAENEIIIAYRDWDNQGFGTVVIGSVNDTETTYGETAVFAQVSVFLPKIKMINNSEFLIVYRDMDAGGKGMLVKGNMNSGNIQFDAPIVFCNSMISTSSLILLNESTFIIAYKDNNNGFGTLLPGTLVDGDILLGEPQVFNAATSFENVLCRLSDNAFVIAYRDAGNGEKGTAKMCRIENEQLSLSEPVIFSEVSATEMAIAPINATDFVISYQSAGEKGESVVGTSVDNNLVIINTLVYSDHAVSGNTIVPLSDSIAAISYTDAANNNYGTTVLLHISTNTITYQDPVVFYEGGSFTTHGVKISDSTFVLAFRNENNNFSGSSVCGKIISDQTTGVECHFQAREIKLFPNPCKAKLSVEGTGIQKIEISNISGQVIKTIHPTGVNTQIDVSYLEKGVYLINVITDINTNIRKVVVE